MEKRIACIGAGNWGRNHVRNFAALGVLRTVCETDPQLLSELATTYPSVKLTRSFDDVLSDDAIQAVVIATPAETHAALVRRALFAGKDVLVEKPLCLTIEEGAELVRLADQLDRVLMVGHLLWYHPAVLKLKELVNSGELGRIQYIYSNRLNLGRIRREENILWSFAPHDISVILGLVGEMPNDVQAQGGNYLNASIADVTVSTLSFRSGIRAHIFVSWLHPYKEQKLVVIGERKMIVFDDLEPQDKLRMYPHKIEWKNQVPVANRAEGEPVAFEMAEPLRAECMHFLECVRDRTQPRTNGAEALRVLSVLAMCQERLDGPLTKAKASVALELSPKQTTRWTDVTVHESAYVDEDVTIGQGTTIWHFSHVLNKSRIGTNCRIGQNVVIGPNAVIGNGVKIQNNVSVYEGVELEDHVFCGPSMVFTNVYNPRSEIRRMDELRRTLVRRGASLGANCTIVCGTTIGEYAFVGAGAVVHRDVPDYALVVGNPGRVVGWMCSCGNRIEFRDDDGSCTACGQTYRRKNGQVTPGEIAAPLIAP